MVLDGIHSNHNDVTLSPAILSSQTSCTQQFTNQGTSINQDLVHSHSDEDEEISFNPQVYGNSNGAYVLGQSSHINENLYYNGDQNSTRVKPTDGVAQYHYHDDDGRQNTASYNVSYSRQMSPVSRRVLKNPHYARYSKKYNYKKSKQFQ